MTTYVREESATTSIENFRFFYHQKSRTATVAEYLGNEANAVIPASMVHNGIIYQVISIGTNAFRDRSLQSVKIPNTISAIRESAFQNNQLRHLVIPDSVTHISANAFRENELVDVVLPKGLEVIGNHVFFRNNLSTIHLPQTISYIGESAFSHNALTHLTLPNSLISIGNSAFSSNQLMSIHLPDSITMLGNSVFYNNQLTDVTLPSGITYISDSLFYRNRLTHITIPNTVTSIGSNAFRENLLNYIDLPSSVISIGNSAFRTNPLAEMHIPASVSSIGHDAFSTLPLVNVYTDDGNATKLTQMLNLNTMRNWGTTRATLLEGKPFFQANYVNTPLNSTATVGGDLTFSIEIQANNYYIHERHTTEWVLVKGSEVPIQWYKEGHALQGENNPALQLTGIQKYQAGIYYAVVNGTKLPDIHLIVEGNGSDNTPTAPYSDFTYHVLREGEARQSLIITNHSTLHVPEGWILQVTFIGGNPYFEWPATFSRAVEGIATAPINAELNARSSITIPIGEGTDISIASVRVNGALASRE